MTYQRHNRCNPAVQAAVLLSRWKKCKLDRRHNYIFQLIRQIASKRAPDYTSVLASDIASSVTYFHCLGIFLDMLQNDSCAEGETDAILIFAVMIGELDVPNHLPKVLLVKNTSPLPDLSLNPVKGQLYTNNFSQVVKSSYPKLLSQHSKLSLLPSPFPDT